MVSGFFGSFDIFLISLFPINTFLMAGCLATVEVCETNNGKYLNLNRSNS